MTVRKKTRPVKAGGLTIGGGAPISIQTMTNLPIEDTDSTIAQIRELQSRGAQIIRLAVHSVNAVSCLKKIRAAVDAVLSADIHFNHQIAIESIKAGVNKVRINPGNIGGAAKTREVVSAAKDYGVPIRVGVNAGSIDREKYPRITPENLAASALDHVKILEDNDFREIVVSIKSSDISQTIEANKIFSELRDYPLHIGLTEAGYGLDCIVWSTTLISRLLFLGLGDTVRVSMTGNPLDEIDAARAILEAAGERKPAIRIISCPTCGRTAPELDILALAGEAKTTAERFEQKLKSEDRSLAIAVMGCEVNGPGEASEADIGLAGARGGNLLLFSKGKKIKKVHKSEAIAELADEIKKIIHI
jgi:(E)-4-hydroxy-3-methylbut-2-enyl-diphosphate synthase